MRGRSSGIVPPILLLLRSMVVIEVKFPKLLSCPPRFATFIFILVMPVPVQVTPCQPSPQGSPPFGIHPGRLGDPSETYSPFIAVTSEASVTARARSGANAAAATSNRTSRSWPPPPPPRAGARLVISARQFTPSGAPSSPRGPAQPLP